MMPTPSTALYLNFVFASIYCFLNTCFGLALYVMTVEFEKTGKQANGVSRAGQRSSAVVDEKPGNPKQIIRKRTEVMTAVDVE